MANEHFKRTPTSTGNRKVFTWSGWVKIGELDTSIRLFETGTSNTTDRSILYFSGNKFQYFTEIGNVGKGSLSTDATFRDVSTWYHVIWAFDAIKNSVKIYVNGVDQPLTSTVAIANESTYINAVNTHYIGQSLTLAAGYLQGALSDIFFIDGQALTPDVFGFNKDGDGYISVGSTQSTDFRPGQWMPHSPAKIKKDVNRRGGFGVNGFYLPMNDSSNPGADFHCDPNSIITLKGEDLPQPRNGSPTTSDAFVSQLREEQGTLGFDGVVKFDGNDNLSIGSAGDFNFLHNGATDWTAEFWVYTGTATRQFAFGTGASSAQVGFNITVMSTSDNQSDGTGVYAQFSRGAAGNYRYWGSNGGLSINTWHHIAAVFKSSDKTLALYVDGIEVDSGTGTENGTFGSGNYSSSNSTYAFTVAKNIHGNSYLTGNISNLRVVSGSRLYTSNFTAPTEPLTNVTNTTLLCCNSSTSATASTVTPGTISVGGDPFATRNELTGSMVLAVPGITGGQGSGYGDYSADIKGSGSNKTVTANGNAGIAATASYYGSAMQFDGTNDSFSIANNSDFYYDGDFTVEAWIFRNNTSTSQTIVGVFENSSARRSWQIETRTNSAIRFEWWSDGTNGTSLTAANDSVPGDQWNHVIMEKDNNTMRGYVNGVVVGISTNAGSIFENTDDPLRIGILNAAEDQDFDGYIQDLRIYKGVAKYKGGFDCPKVYTPVGIELWRTTADTCKNNFCAWNPLSASAGNSDVSFADGNLRLTSTVDSWPMRSATFGISSGKWYFESYTTDTTRFGVGWGSDNNLNTTTFTTSGANSYLFWSDDPASKYELGTKTALNGSPAFTIGDISGIAIDFDAGEIWYSINGTWTNDDSGNVGNPSDGSNPQSTFTANIEMYPNTMLNLASHSTNFGQNPSFSGNTTAGTFTDSNGKGLFKYQPPTDFLALCEDNLPTPAIADPGEHFKTVLWTGDGVTDGRGITGVGFQPDLIWIKRRDASNASHIVDSVRGVNFAVASDLTLAEWSPSQLGSFSSDGFSMDGTGAAVNSAGGTYVSWCWKAGGAAVSNTDGTITSQVSANQTAGFSIVSYTGTGSAATVGHGLGKAPTFILSKSLNQSGTPTVGWGVFHVGGSYSNSMLYLSPGTAGQSTDTNVFTTTTQTNSVFSIGNWSGINENGKNYIAYCWTEIEGYSKFGSYVANADTDGPFVYCGFKPAWVLVKNTSATPTNWELIDSVRSSSNGNNAYLIPNDSGQEYYTEAMDLLSNGFKLRTTSSGWNGHTSGDTYIFAAFAESPFQTTNAK